MADLPSWARLVGKKALWWSSSQSKYMAVRIWKLDEAKRLVYITFEINPDSWKAVRFCDLLGSRGGKCLLQPPEDWASADSAEDSGGQEEGEGEGSAGGLCVRGRVSLGLDTGSTVRREWLLVRRLDGHGEERH